MKRKGGYHKCTVWLQIRYSTLRTSDRQLSQVRHITWTKCPHPQIGPHNNQSQSILVKLKPKYVKVLWKFKTGKNMLNVISCVHSSWSFTKNPHLVIKNIFTNYSKDKLNRCLPTNLWHYIYTGRIIHHEAYFNIKHV